MRTSKRGQRRQVLSEDEYTSTLSSIVQRDFFPDLPALEKQAAVLDRREAKDFKGAVAVRRAARRLVEHEESLKEQEEHDEHDLDPHYSVRKTARPLHRESVSGFHARVTSEDNQEFDQNLRKELQAKKERIEAFYRNPVLAITDGSSEERNSLDEPSLLASDQFNTPANQIEATKNPQLDNGLFFVPQLQRDQRDISGEGAKLLANGETVVSSSDTQLMPPPAPVRKGEVGTSSLPKQTLVEYIPKHSLGKRVEPARTRFPEAVSAYHQSRVGHAGGDSTTDYSTEASTDLDSPLHSVQHERNARVKHQKGELETLVAMTPLIQPGDRSACGTSPITTWGTISSTPMVLGSSNNTEQSFCLPEESSRDHAARVAEEKVAKRRAQTTQRLRSSPRADRIAANLTPAARALLNKSIPRRSSSVRSASAFSNALRKSYTPQRRQSVSTIAYRATPRRQSQQHGDTDAELPRMSTTTRTSGNITDGLLNIK